MVRSLSSRVLLSKIEAVVRQPTGWQVTTTDLNGVRGLVGDLEIEGTKCQVSPVAERDEGGSLVWVLLHFRVTRDKGQRITLL